MSDMDSVNWYEHPIEYPTQVNKENIAPLSAQKEVKASNKIVASSKKNKGQTNVTFTNKINKRSNEI